MSDNKFVDWLFGNKEEPEEVEAIPEVGEEIIQRVESPQATIYRPLTWDEYIGQAKAKKMLKQYIKGTQDRGMLLPHILISGHAGTGKTTLAKLIAKETKVEMKELITSTIEEFWKLKMLINNSAGQILFLDEIHALDRKNAEKIYSIMEDFAYNGSPVEEFTLIGATTELGEMINKAKPFYDRFKMPIELEEYKTEELVLIIKQYKEKIFPLDKVTDECYTTIALNARGVPRIAIRILEGSIYFGNVMSVLYNSGILKDGFTQKDLKVLKYITKNPKGVGLQSIASFLGTSVKNYLYQVEPYLMQKEVIIRTPRGRRITAEGLELIQILEEIK